jgi:two-component system, cell cycle sensor histidine kinase and response regulator CckA
MMDRELPGGERWSESDRRPRATDGTAYGGTKTILVVEDDDAVRHVTRRALEDAGYTVLAAASGPDAIRAVEAYDGPIHLVVADVVMPGMSGPACVERLRSTRPGVPALYVSGHSDAVLDAHRVDRTRDFVRKPFTPSELMRAIRALLG